MKINKQSLSLMLPSCILIMLTGCGGGATDATTATVATASRTYPDAVTEKLVIPTTLFNYSNPTLPTHFLTNTVQSFDNTPTTTSTSDDIATLGRVLFYEKQLSANTTTACASCHTQADGFTDPRQFSLGFAGVATNRNSMGLANVRFYENGHFFWDERADTLEDQTLIPIQSDVEMGLTLDEAVSNINNQDYYAFLFEQAFGDSTVTSVRIATALSQFIRSMVSYESVYDQGVQDNFANFSASQNRGRGLFFSRRTNCAACHVNDRNNGNEAIFQPNRPLNNGLDADLVNTDNGQGDVTGNTNDNGEFKVSSLRNIAETAPYMHDGRFATLADVIEHYDSGVQAHPNLDNRLQRNGLPRQLNLSAQDKTDLIAFLQTLTDDVFLTEEKFSDPFR